MSIDYSESVVYSRYDNVHTNKWTYRFHGELQQVIPHVISLSQAVTTETLRDNLEKSGRYMLIDDVTGDVHVVTLSKETMRS